MHIIRARAANDDGSGKVAADHQRERDRCSPGIRAHEGVHLVDRDRLHPYQHLPGAGRRVGKFAIADPAGITESLNVGGSHIAIIPRAGAAAGGGACCSLPCCPLSPSSRPPRSRTEGGKRMRLTAS